MKWKLLIEWFHNFGALVWLVLFWDAGQPSADEVM